MFDRNAIKVGVIANQIVSEVCAHGSGEKLLLKKTDLPEAKSTRIVRHRTNALIGVGMPLHFLGSISGLHVARTALIQANSSANECLSELNVVVLLRSATRYA